MWGCFLEKGASNKQNGEMVYWDKARTVHGVPSLPVRAELCLTGLEHIAQIRLGNTTVFQTYLLECKSRYVLLSVRPWRKKEWINEWPKAHSPPGKTGIVRVTKYIATAGYMVLSVELPPVVPAACHTGSCPSILTICGHLHGIMHILNTLSKNYTVCFWALHLACWLGPT